MVKALTDCGCPVDLKCKSVATVGPTFPTGPAGGPKSQRNIVNPSLPPPAVASLLTAKQYVEGLLGPVEYCKF